MATTGVFNGTIMALTISDAGTYEPIAYATTKNLDLSTNMLDITDDSTGGWKAFLAGDKQGKASISGHVVYNEGASEQNWDQLYAAWTGGTALTVRWKTAVSGDTYIQASAYVDSLSQDAPHDSPVTFSATLQFSGALTTGTNV